MELTEDQRAELTAISAQGDGAAYARDARPITKDAYRERRQQLQALREAWNALDHDTRMHMAVAVAGMWDDDRDDAPLPDLTPVIDDLLSGMRLPGHRPEDVPGLGRAAVLLWAAWCAQQPGGDVPIDREAREAIGAEVASLFGITALEGERRAVAVLRSLDQRCQLPRRKGYGA